MATLAQIKSAVDTWLTPKWTAVQNLQATRLANTGTYFQGLITHLAIPADNASTAPDNLAAHPTDQADRWADFLTLPATIPCGLRLDVYDGPDGMGFTATVYVVVLGTLYARTVQVGPETWRTAPWAAVSVIP